MLLKHKLLILWLIILFVIASTAVFWQISRRQVQKQSLSSSSTQAYSGVISGGSKLQKPIDVKHLSLLNSREGESSFANFEGKLVLAFFGSTACPDVCPIPLLALADIYTTHGEPEDVQILMVTVDPDRDTADRVQRYVKNLHNSFLGLSGSNSEIGKALEAFFVAATELAKGLFEHTDVVFALDRYVQIRRLYGHQDIDALANDFSNLYAGQW